MGVFDNEMYLNPKYNHLEKYVDICYRSFWTPAKYQQLIHKVDMPHFNNVMFEVDKEPVRRCAMAVALVEDKVKVMFPTLVFDLPQTIIGDIGGLIGQQEISHRRSYHALNEELGIDVNDLYEHKALQGRIKYLTKHLEKDPKIIGKKRILKKLVLFTALVERCSLYTQFYILMSYAKHNKGLKTISALQSTTCKEEACFKDGTELLTKNGWVDFKDVNVGDLVYGFKEGILKEEPVLKVIEKDWDGNLIKIGNSRHRSTMTPDHDIIYQRGGNWIKKQVKDFKGDSRSFFPVTGDFISDSNYKLTWLDRIKIAIQADGNKKFWKNKAGEVLARGKNGGYNYGVALYKKRKIERFRYLLNNLKEEDGDFKFSERIVKPSGSKGEGVVFSIYLDEHEVGDLKSLQWLNNLDLSKSLCEDIIDELMNWDGSYSGGAMCYTSTNRDNIDIVQKIAILAGYRTNLYENSDSKRKETFNNCFKLSFSNKDSELVCAHSYLKEEEYYQGKVRCVTVPSGGIITRSSDGVMITGNCHYQFGLDLVNIIKEEYPQLWDEYLIDLIEKNIKDAYKAELSLIDWIFEKGVPDHITKEEVVNFLNDNFNTVIKDLQLGIKPYKVDLDMYEEKNSWFNQKVFITAEPDFFDNADGSYSFEEETIDLNDFQF